MDSDSAYNAAFWLGLVGAAAWVPQIAGWVSKALAKPSVKVLPGQSVEIGFNNLGPIVNLPIAVLVKKKDALITDMTLRAVHENGETHLLQWMWIHEVMSIIRGLPGNMNFSKQDRAIALLASREALLNKTIGFQDTNFHEEYRQRSTALIAQYKFLKDRQNGRDDFLQSRELAIALEWFTNCMYWTDGKYRLEVELQVEGLQSRVKAVFSTTLTRPETDTLRENIEKMRGYVTTLVNGDARGEVAPEPIWNWIAPMMSDEP